MQYYNEFELIVAVVFNVIPRIGGIGPKFQDLVIPFCLGEGYSPTEFHLRALTINTELILMKDKTGQINSLT